MARGPKKVNPQSFKSIKAQEAAAKSKAAAKKPSKAPAKKFVEESDEDDESGNDNYLAFERKDRDSDDESEEEVFNLNVNDSDEEDDDEEDEEDDDDDDEDDEDDDDDEEDDDEDSDDDDDDDDNDLKHLVNSLPSNLKQKILSKNTQNMSDDDDEEDEDDEEEDERWGKRKEHWAGDTADLEIGQDMQDALDEEEAAKELINKKLKKMKDQDFYDDLDQEEDSDEEDDDEDDDEDHAHVIGNKLQGSKTNKTTSIKSKISTKDKIAKELEAIALHANHTGDFTLSETKSIEHLTKDISRLTKQQKLDLIATHSPELIGIITELKERIDELQHRVNPIQQQIKLYIHELSSQDLDDDLISYLEVKQQLLLTYCINVIFYLYMKTLGKSVSNHPVMRQLLRLRYIMEKLAPIDNKLKYQIDRLMKLSDGSASAEDIKSGLLRPNLAALMEEEDEDDEDSSNKKKKSSKKSKKDMMDSDEEDDEDEEKPKNAGVYRPPKTSFVPYPNEKQAEKDDKRMEKAKSRLRSSEMIHALRSEFDNAPDVSGSGGVAEELGDMQRLAEEENERTQFEEDHFVRLTVSRKEKKDKKRREREATRLDNFDDIGDFGDLEEMSKLAASLPQNMMKSSNKNTKNDSFQSSASSAALQKALMAFQESHRDEEDDDEDIYHSKEDRKRKRAPLDDEDYGDIGGYDDEEGDEDEDIDADNVFDNYVDKKKEFLSKKKEHYTPAPRYGGYEEAVGEGNKRAASYEMIKNKGLTPHRKKENRNPRVKKRLAYEKAVIARKGQVREVKTGMADTYSGELGIKSQLSRSRKM